MVRDEAVLLDIAHAAHLILDSKQGIKSRFSKISKPSPLFCIN